MKPENKKSLLGLASVTALFAASILTMFAVAGEFHAVWFISSLVAWLALCLLAWILPVSMARRGRTAEAERYRMPQRPDVTRSVDAPWRERPAVSSPNLQMPTRAAERHAGALAAAEVTPPWMPEEAPSPAVEIAPAPEAPAPTPAPSGFEFRGFKLYERPGPGGKPVRFFSSKQPPGSRPIELPEGFEPQWDTKLRKPLLQSLSKPEAAPVAEPTKVAQEAPLEVVVERKPCSAILGPGEFCHNPAREDSPYCGRHANWKPKMAETEIVVVQDRAEGAAGKRLRPGAAAVEVVVAKPKGAQKPLKIRPPQIEVEQDHAEPAKTKLKPSTSALEVVQDRPEAGAPLRLPEPNLDVRADHVIPKRPFRPSETHVEVRADRTAFRRPIRVADTEVEVRAPKTAQHRPLRPAAPEIQVRADRAPPKKAFRVASTRLEVRADHAHTMKPLKVTQPKLVLREAKAHKIVVPRALSRLSRDFEVSTARGTPVPPLGARKKSARKTKPKRR